MIDLGKETLVREIGTTFLQVVNHIVFFPVQVTYYSSPNGKEFLKLGTIPNKRPLTQKSKINDTQSFDLEFTPLKARYVKIHARNPGLAPFWHFGAGLSTWVFADEVEVR